MEGYGEKKKQRVPKYISKKISVEVNYGILVNHERCKLFYNYSKVV